ncbi:MAG: hypothetical protein HY075_03885, partial [Deltaproteobacteria bacterium]|nr:hypothetical protein [Deltaproteobacteria bacterium]
RVWPWEEAKYANLPQDRVGDLIIANAPGFGWAEDISEDKVVLRDSLKGGYKQAVEPRSSKGMLTPFVAWGPGIRAGNALAKPIEHVDQYRTIMHLLGLEAPAHASGRVLDELLERK